jgi:hypothetical protein
VVGDELVVVELGMRQNRHWNSSWTWPRERRAFYR